MSKIVKEISPETSQEQPEPIPDSPPYFPRSLLSCLCTNECRINNSSSPQIPLDILLGERSSWNIFADVVKACVWEFVCVKAWRIYWHAEGCDLRKVRHEWNLQEPALAAPLSFQSPHALFLIMCNMLVICVCVWWVTALIVKGSGRFGLKCTTTHAAQVYKQNITQESQLVLVHCLGRTFQTPLKGVG